LSFDGIIRIAKERLNVQVLLNPPEKQFDLPTLFIKLGNAECLEFKVVGQEYQGFASFWVFEPYAAKLFGISIPTFFELR
jgi:hypothetical protein